MVKGVYETAIPLMEYFVVMPSGKCRYYGNECEKKSEDGVIYVYDYYEALCDNRNAVEFLRRCKSWQVRSVDASYLVNEFYFNGKPMWLDKATRSGLSLRLQAEAALGGEMTSLWYNGEEHTLSINVAQEMLIALEVYASACYDNTQRNLATIASITSEQLLFDFDVLQGYPDKLEFAFTADEPQNGDESVQPEEDMEDPSQQMEGTQEESAEPINDL